MEEDFFDEITAFLEPNTIGGVTIEDDTIGHETIRDETIGDTIESETIEGVTIDDTRGHETIGDDIIEGEAIDDAIGFDTIGCETIREGNCGISWCPFNRKLLMGISGVTDSTGFDLGKRESAGFGVGFTELTGVSGWELAFDSLGGNNLPQRET
uniref:Uncharacterized protein n=1 Tax=Bursaphelenchus xylophilus TaxID=6326 RepID=A0A1I7SBC5_BURXY